MSNSNTEMWSLQVRSMVDLRAMDSIPSSNACAFLSFSLKLFHCTMHLFQHNISFQETTTKDTPPLLRNEKCLHKLVSKGLPPKLASLCLVHLVRVALKRTPRKHGLQLPQNVAEQQGQFGQVPPTKYSKKKTKRIFRLKKIEICIFFL